MSVGESGTFAGKVRGSLSDLLLRLNFIDNKFSSLLDPESG
jgi:hypothetical protein